MTDEIPIGPNPCHWCGGEYGEHEPRCNFAPMTRANPLTMDALQVAEVISVLKAEIARLKAGDFTPEEFQNLCHKFSEKDRECFFRGCAEYQRKLFGVADIDRLGSGVIPWSTTQ